MPTNPFPIERDNCNYTSIADRAVLLRNLETKKLIVNQVIDGRLPLFEAADRFGVVCGLETDREVACRSLIGWVALSLCDRPEQADSVSDRLERELQNFLDNSESSHLRSAK